MIGVIRRRAAIARRGCTRRHHGVTGQFRTAGGEAAGRLGKILLTRDGEALLTLGLGRECPLLIRRIVIHPLHLGIECRELAGQLGSPLLRVRVERRPLVGARRGRL